MRLHGHWIYIYLCNQCRSPLKLWVVFVSLMRCSRHNFMWLERFEDNKGVIWSSKLNDRQWTKEKGRTMMYRTLHNKLNIDQHNPTNNWRWNQVLQKGKQFMLHMWHPSCYSCYKPGDKSWMRMKWMNGWNDRIVITTKFVTLVVRHWLVFSTQLCYKLCHSDAFLQLFPFPLPMKLTAMI
jgi:hypothetical protein